MVQVIGKLDRSNKPSRKTTLRWEQVVLTALSKNPEFKRLSYKTWKYMPAHLTPKAPPRSRVEQAWRPAKKQDEWTKAGMGYMKAFRK